MEEDNQATFDNLRSKILEELVPLIEDAKFDPEQKFDLFLASARTTTDVNRYDRAYEAAQSIESPEAKAGAFLDLLDAIEDASASASFAKNDLQSQSQN